MVDFVSGVMVGIVELGLGIGVEGFIEKVVRRGKWTMIVRVRVLVLMV